MDWSLRELRYFVTAADVGSFTDAAEELHVSQAAVSRTIASLERAVGDRVLRRIPRGCEPTATGQQILPHARRVLAEADRFSAFLRSRHSTLRLGYAWAGLGRHTAALQRTWARDHADIELELVKRNTPTAGLAEGTCDVAVLRRATEDARLESVVVGLERRIVAFASDDPQWARRRQLSMAELAERPILIDPRTGSTTGEMWAGLPTRPTFVESGDVDQWLDSIAAGKAIGTTAEATAHHHVRPGVTYRPVKDGPRIPVRLVWWRDDRPRGLAELVDVVTRLYAATK
jgi:DNA-binding transcriptional LysR family regulator